MKKHLLKYERETPEIDSETVLACADYLARPMTPRPGKTRWCNDQRVEDPERNTPFVMLPWTVRAIVSG